MVSAQGSVEPVGGDCAIQLAFARRTTRAIPGHRLPPRGLAHGRYVAYQSNESGRDQVYVRPFPRVNDGVWPVSTGGGTRPAWAKTGRELFYLDDTNALTAVPVQTSGATFVFGNAKKLFDTTIEHRYRLATTT